MLTLIKSVAELLDLAAVVWIFRLFRDGV